MEWIEVAHNHFAREDGAEVWRIDSDFAASIAGWGGLWYGTDDFGHQTRKYATRLEAMDAVDRLVTQS